MLNRQRLSLLLAALSGWACTDASPSPVPSVPVAALEPPLALEELTPLVRRLTVVELLSESVTNSLIVLGDKVFVRDFDGVAEFFAPGFRGHDPFRTAAYAASALPLGAERRVARTDEFEVVDGQAWVAALERRIGSWRRVEQSLWKVRGAEFRREDPITSGQLELGVYIVGVTQAGGREVLELHGSAQVERMQAGWRLQKLLLDEAEEAARDLPFFVDVTRAAGVHHEGIRYGQPGNATDGWNGAACGDANGDGRWDLFVPSSTRSFLYLAQPGGGYREAAEAWGLAGDAAGTGAVWFDYDNDGDQDLCVAHVGWETYDRTPAGEPLALYRNDGEAFTEVTAELGLAHLRHAAFSLCVLDYDLDGFLDLYVASYGRMEAQRNDQWVESTNGAPDALLRNRGGVAFEDVSVEAGIDGRSWSYSAAAADYDSDGDLDIYVGTNFGSNRLWSNRGDGTFEELARSAGAAQRGNTMGVTFGDLNNDGRLDLFLSNPSSNTGRRILARFEAQDRPRDFDDLSRMAAGNALLLGVAPDEFAVASGKHGAAGAGWAWGTALADLDLDGHLDVVCANGFVTGDLPQDT